MADDVAEACTPEGATEPQQQCVFDAVATGDISVGVASMDTLTENTIAMTESSEHMHSLHACVHLHLRIFLCIQFSNTHAHKHAHVGVPLAFSMNLLYLVTMKFSSCHHSTQT